MNPLAENQPWWQPYAELLFWVLLAIGLMMFAAYQPSADDLIKGLVGGAVIAVWGQVAAKIAEMRTKKQERSRSAEYLARTLEERVGQPITEQTVKEVSHEVSNRPQ